MAKREKRVRSPGPSKSHENELERLLSAMVRTMGREFRKGAVEPSQGQFSDAAEGPIRGYMRRADEVRRELERQFDDERIEKMVRGVIDKTNKRNHKELVKRVQDRVGIDSKELTRLTDIEGQVSVLIQETQSWVENLRDETLELYTENTLSALSEGKSQTHVKSKYDGLDEKRRNHAKFTARNQIRNFTSITTKVRAQNIGITRARWITSKDERVRECHRVRNGRTFKLSEGLYSSCDGLHLQPGVDYQCRCDYMLIIPEDL